MCLYKLFSYSAEVQYKSVLLSKATLFTIITTVLNLLLPFVIAYRSKGFWLRTHNFFEQPKVQFTYEYLLLVESDDPSRTTVCGETNGYYQNAMKYEEDCSEFEVQEFDFDGDRKNDLLEFRFQLNLSQDRTIKSIMLILVLDFQLKTVCPLHMQSLAVISKDFVVPPSGLKYFSDLEFHQVSHLPCKQNNIHTKYNRSVFSNMENSNNNAVDFILEKYYMREVTTKSKTLYSRSQNGHTGSMQMQISLRVPEMDIKYIPSLMQELKWAWPQYLSLVAVFYFFLNRIKRFVFNKRLLMAWEVVPWKKCKYKII